MPLFSPKNRSRTRQHEEIWAAYEIAHTAVDFGAALCFVLGSVAFFDAAWERAGVWLFLVGSVLFAAKPSLRLAREVHYWRMGKTDWLARRLQAEDG